MSKLQEKNSQRFVMYVPRELRREIQLWAAKKNMTMAEFGRAAFETYLNGKKRQERNEQLMETCRMFESTNQHLSTDWVPAEN